MPPRNFTLNAMSESDLDFHINIWDCDIGEIYRENFNKPFFYPYILKKNKQLVGVSELIINGTSAWLGLVVVLEEFRNLGLGTAMVKYIMSEAVRLGCITQVLYASEMGKPIYDKLGFHSEITFVLYLPTQPATKELIQDIIPITEIDYEQVLLVDRFVTGEDRSLLLADCWADSVKYIENGEITGYFLPNYGIGSLIATTEKAAENLVDYKCQSSKPDFIFPERNTFCRKLLENRQYKYEKNYPRMVYGKPLDFHPDFVFCRGTGYSG
jgi:GNAT superfamily N-acetyltransferase